MRGTPLWARIAVSFSILTLVYLLIDAVDQGAPGHHKGLADQAIEAVVRAAIISPWVIVYPIYQGRRAARVTQIKDPDELRTVIRASTRGPIPVDPRLRHAARVVAEDQLEQRRSRRPFAVFFVALFTVAVTAAAIYWSHWYVLIVLASLALIADMWTAPRRLQRRIDLLTEPDRDPVSPGSGG